MDTETKIKIKDANEIRRVAAKRFERSEQALVEILKYCEDEKIDLRNGYAGIMLAETINLSSTISAFCMTFNQNPKEIIDQIYSNLEVGVRKIQEGVDKVMLKAAEAAKTEEDAVSV